MEESSTKVWHHTPSSEVLRLLGVERLVQIKSLQVDESALTGESVPVHKHTDALALDTVLADRRNLAFAGTLVTAGQGEAVVSATGDRTETGNIARLIASAVELSTPQTKKIAQFSGLVLSVILGLAATTFVVGVVRGEKAVEMFMAAVALAVGAIPGGGARRRDGGAGHWRVAHGKKKSHYPQTPRRRNARQHDGYLFGIRVIMATGDNAKIAAVVAKQLNIDEVRAGVEPKDKRELVLALKAKGESAAMAGDGVNDAPALAEADVGIAMGTGPT